MNIGGSSSELERGVGWKRVTSGNFKSRVKLSMSSRNRDHPAIRIFTCSSNLDWPIVKYNSNQIQQLIRQRRIIGPLPPACRPTGPDGVLDTNIWSLSTVRPVPWPSLHPERERTRPSTDTRPQRSMPSFRCVRFQLFWRVRCVHDCMTTTCICISPQQGGQ